MAVPRMSPADEDAIGTLQESFHDVDRINGTGTHEPDDAYVCRVLDPRCAGQIGRRIRTPVTNEGNYSRFELHNESFQVRATSIIVKTSSFSKFFCWVTPLGQAVAQAPQP